MFRRVKRLARIEGQVRGISRMVSKDTYCDDVINQITAVQSALGAVKRFYYKIIYEAVLEKALNKKNTPSLMNL